MLLLLKFLGSRNESLIIDKFISELNNSAICKNLAGKVSLAYIPEILRNCKLLLSVETGTVHIAKAVGCPVICLSNGMYWGHYQPYPDGTVKYIYPKKFKSILENADYEMLKKLYIFNPDININEVNPYEVVDTITGILKNDLNSHA